MRDALNSVCWWVKAETVGGVDAFERDRDDQGRVGWPRTVQERDAGTEILFLPSTAVFNQQKSSNLKRMDAGVDSSRCGRGLKGDRTGKNE